MTVKVGPNQLGKKDFCVTKDNKTDEWIFSDCGGGKIEIKNKDFDALLTEATLGLGNESVRKDKINAAFQEAAELYQLV